jgi:CRISPR-associated protein Csb2
MSSNLVITIRFLQPHCHGRSEGGEPEWPPSPLRLLQSLVAAAAARWNERRQLEHAKPALQWLESLRRPAIVASVASAAKVSAVFYVPDNTAELLVPAWKRGEANVTPKRTEKVVRPSHLLGDAIHYVYPLPDGACPHLEILKAAARSITHFGWGIDMAVGDACLLSAEQVAQLQGVRWNPSPTGGTPLRVPKVGTLDDLIRKHADFLSRITTDGFRPVPPLRVFDIIRYRSEHEPAQRPFRLFELRNLDGSRFRYSHRKLIHIAGMVRHLAIEAMKQSPPRGVGNEWVKSYVAGHVSDRSQSHRQLSYLPLPSVGHDFTDPGIRRVMILAPAGDDAWLDHVARRLAGQQLQALNAEFGVNENGQPKPGPILVPLSRSGDSVTRRYTGLATVWHSFTPVILPGHNDFKRDKTRFLIERALSQVGVEQPCDFEWSAFSRFRKSYTAHKYNRDRRPQGYIRPNHLLSQPAVHLTLRFHDGSAEKRPVAIPGPLALGAGRHFGLGLFVAVDQQPN